jgi:hypothetical protein
LRRELPLFLGVLAGLVVIFARLFQAGVTSHVLDATDKWFSILSAFMVGLGLVNLTSIHLKQIARRHPNWLYSVLLLVAMYAYAVIVVVNGEKGAVTKWVFNNMLLAMSSTLYGMVAFWITTCAYRAFRVRTLEGTILLVVAALVVLGTAPIGSTIWHPWAQLATWLTNVPTTGAFRAIQIGSFLGFMATGIRILLGLERSHLGAGLKQG